MKTFGERFRFFQPDGLFDGTFLGTRVTAPPAYDLASRILNRLPVVDRFWGQFERDHVLGAPRFP